MIKQANYAYEIWIYENAVQLAYIRVYKRRCKVGQSIVLGLVRLCKRLNKRLIVYPEPIADTPLRQIKQFYQACGLIECHDDDNNLFYSNSK